MAPHQSNATPPTPAPTPTEPRWSFPRLAAVCCSVALVGAYVAYRGGATLLPSTKSDRVVPAESDAVAPDERVIMPSSKSGPVTPPSTRGARTMMPGSKSAVLTDSLKDVAHQPATQP
jgi:hypothetical protein